MMFNQMGRREFVKSSLSALALSSLPFHVALGQTATKTRVEWQEFKTTSAYPSFLDAVRLMRANNNAADKASWQYWINVHVNYCPHDAPYFLAWHRGYLSYFEQQLRVVSGNSELALPYWDYYSYASIPSEFTDQATDNPLYVTRMNTNVYNALTLAPYSPEIINFQRGTVNAYETSHESAPHNPVHNIIGAAMATMQSPNDPIFWLHHANVDRLWAAWVAANAGRTMPSSSSSYWKGKFTYASKLTLNRNQTYSTTGLGYTYSNLALPSSLPPQAQAARFIRVQAQAERSLNRPPLAAFPTAPSRPTGTNRLSLGGVTGVSLAGSVSARVPIDAARSQSLQAVLAAAKGGQGQISPEPYKSVQVVLDDVSLTDAGRLGGYFYNVYLNVPESGDTFFSPERHYLGTLGPFEIASRSHHGSSARLTYPATRILAAVAPDSIGEVTVSLVRVNGQNSPAGPTLTIGELRVEISADEIE